VAVTIIDGVIGVVGVVPAATVSILTAVFSVCHQNSIKSLAARVIT
jgi:hypothetical protein